MLLNYFELRAYVLSLLQRYVWCLCSDADALAAVCHVVQWQLQRRRDAALPAPSARVVIWLDQSFLAFDVGTCQVLPRPGGALQLLLQAGGEAERLFIGFDFMGRSRGSGRLQAGLGGAVGVGRQAALCFVAHIASSQQVSAMLAQSVTGTRALFLSLCSTGFYSLREHS